MLPDTDRSKLLPYPKVNIQVFRTSYIFFLTSVSDMSFPVYSISAHVIFAGQSSSIPC